MEVLTDVVATQPRVVFCGMAGAESPRLREHYYETPGNAFWELLHESGIVPTRLGPDQDREVAGFGLGLTDLVAHHAVDPPSYEIDELVDRIARWQPEWLAFTSKTVAAVVARHLGVRRPGLGPTGWDLAGASVFVLPGSSGANRRRDYDGRPDRLSWWRDLAGLAGF